MALLTPEFLFRVEKRMQIIYSGEYERLTKKLWWDQVAHLRPMTGMAERLIWLLDTAGIDYTSQRGGEINFADIVSKSQEFTALAATGGLRVNRFDFEDSDGGGIDAASHWIRQISSYSAYWPQKQVAKAIRLGSAATSLAYDGLTFFNTAHPVNPFQSNGVVYANDFTGAPSGNYPGALKIDPSITTDVAFANMQTAFRYVQGILMPNGVDPRMLRPFRMIVPPALKARAQQLTDAKFIAQAAASGGGTADIEAIISNWGMAPPIEAPELGASVTDGAAGSDTTWYLLAETAGSDQMGPIIYGNREPFEVIYHNQITSAELARSNFLQWTTRGRNVVAYGHPYLLFRFQAA